MARAIAKGISLPLFSREIYVGTEIERGSIIVHEDYRASTRSKYLLHPSRGL